MSKYLVDDQPLIVLPKLAQKIGLNESLFLQQIHYWLLQKRHIKEGYYWTYNSYPDWLKQFPFWSESTLKRTVTKLENEGLIITGNYNSLKIDKTKWYRIDYDKLKEITSDIEEFDGRVPSVQNDPTDGSKYNDEEVGMNRPLPETTTKTTTNNKNIKTLPQQVEGPSNNELEEQFEQWYSFYPKKVNKKKAFDKFKLKVKKHGFEKVLQGMASYAKVMELNGTEKQYIKGPDVFLNGEHYLDDHSELIKQKPAKQQTYKPWEELAYGTTSNSSTYDDYSQQLPKPTKQIGW